MYPSPRPHQAMVFNEPQDLVFLCRSHRRKRPEQGENGRSVLKIAACEFANDERMAKDPPLAQGQVEPRRSPSQMVDPYRCIDKDHVISLQFVCE